jgi:aryl-alcohol dehydrogenase-like predicted oxidoreductase
MQTIAPGPIAQEGFHVFDNDSRISRRTFVYQTGLLAGGAMLGAGAAGALAAEGPAASGELLRRVLGKTQVSLTALTLGTAPCGFAKPYSPQNVADCVNAAIDLGINAIDTAPAYDVAEEGVGLGLGKRRKEVFLSTKVMADTIAAAEKSFSKSLRMLKTDYVDLVYFHHLGDRKVDVAMNPDGVFTWLLKQKQAGKARFVGVSGHNRPRRFARFLDSGAVDVLLTIVNFVDRHTYNFERDVLPVARKNGVGIVAMKVFGGSRGSNYADPNCPPQLATKHLKLAVRYTLGIPGVTTLNIGVHNVGQLRKNVEMVRGYKPLSPDEESQCTVLGRQLSAEWSTHFGPLVRARYSSDGLA